MTIKEMLYRNLSSKYEWYEKYGMFDNVREVMAKLKVSEIPCPKKYWMGMPSMGQVIANTWFRPVFFYSPTQSASFIPAFASPNQNPPITIALIPELAHYVTLRMKDSAFPIPRFPSIRALGMTLEQFEGWQEKYLEHLNLFQEVHNTRSKGKGKAKVIELD